MHFLMNYNLRFTKARRERVERIIKQWEERIKELEQYQEEEGDCPCAGREMAELGFSIRMIRGFM